MIKYHNEDHQLGKRVFRLLRIAGRQAGDEGMYRLENDVAQVQLPICDKGIHKNGLK